MIEGFESPYGLELLGNVHWGLIAMRQRWLGGLNGDFGEPITPGSGPARERISDKDDFASIITIIRRNPLWNWVTVIGGEFEVFLRQALCETVGLRNSRNLCLTTLS